MFYKTFNPMVENLKLIKPENNIIGVYENENIYIGTGKYGPYIKYNNKFYSIPNQDIDYENAIKYLVYPKNLGKYLKTNIELYNKYIKYGKKTYPLNDEPENITLEKSIEIIKNNDYKYSNILKTFTIKNKIINIKKGKYGNYLEYGSTRIPIPNVNVEEIDNKFIIDIIANKK